jgi:3-keto-5-aminohexanoate cleavage enzyme
VRDERGAIVGDPAVFSRTLDVIQARTDLVVNGSTGGKSQLSREERCVALTDPRVEVSSLNTGSTNIADGVYVNTFPDIRYWARRMRQASVVPELQVFAPGMIDAARDLAGEGVLAEPLFFNVCLGFPGATPASARHLQHFVDVLRPGEAWGFLHEGMNDLRLTATALGMGASLVRVGFEDGGYLRPDRPARTNAELVEQLVSLVRSAGCEPASAAEARTMLGTRRVADV